MTELVIGNVQFGVNYGIANSNSQLNQWCDCEPYEF